MPAVSFRVNPLKTVMSYQIHKVLVHGGALHLPGRRRGGPASCAANAWLELQVYSNTHLGDVTIPITRCWLGL
jgi:hypothetical protein